MLGSKDAGGSPAAAKAELAEALEESRRRTIALLEPISDAEIHRQATPLLSPLHWDLGHVANFEELWLLRALDGRPPTSEDLDRLYNPFENPRWTRSELRLPDRATALAYGADVRADVLRLLRTLELDSGNPLLRGGYVFRMVVQHEAQHQETMLQTLALLDHPHPLARRLLDPPAPCADVDDEARVMVPGGPFDMGTTDRTEAYDNERPRHRVDLPPFAIDRYPVTNRRWLKFMEDDGYARRELWSGDGWTWCCDEEAVAPRHWARRGDAWVVQRFGTTTPVDPREPVEHVSWYEADAFCRWAGGRLPIEAEWEKAAAWDPASGTSRKRPWGDAPPTQSHANLDQRLFRPDPVGSHPLGASALGVEQLVGDVYEWTASDFLPYEGFEAFPYREYSEVFFGDTCKVLRGASWAIRSHLARCTYRNWDYPSRRQVFAGLRVAWDVPR